MTAAADVSDLDGGARSCRCLGSVLHTELDKHWKPASVSLLHCDQLSKDVLRKAPLLVIDLYMLNHHVPGRGRSGSDHIGFVSITIIPLPFIYMGLLFHAMLHPERRMWQLGSPAAQWWPIRAWFFYFVYVCSWTFTNLCWACAACSAQLRLIKVPIGRYLCGFGLRCGSLPAYV